MKKIMIGLGVLAMMCLMAGCGINCPSLPPKKAITHDTGGMGMQYHFTLYFPQEGEFSSLIFVGMKKSLGYESLVYSV